MTYTNYCPQTVVTELCLRRRRIFVDCHYLQLFFDFFFFNDRNTATGICDDKYDTPDIVRINGIELIFSPIIAVIQMVLLNTAKHACARVDSL